MVDANSQFNSQVGQSEANQAQASQGQAGKAGQSETSQGQAGKAGQSETSQAQPISLQSDSRNPLRLFRNRNYLLYFGGQLISQIGTWMQMVALSWFTYSMTNSPFLLALVGASSQLPALVLMPFAGVVADRFNRHKIVIATQTAAMLQSGLLAYLTLTHQVTVVQLVLLGTMAGIINAFDMPSRSAFVVGLVEKKTDLPQAIAMNSSLMNLTRLLGPAIAGFTIAAMGSGMCFLINCLSYLAVIAALLFIKGNFKPRSQGRKSVFVELADGLHYTWQTTPVRALILLLAVYGVGGMAYAMLLPVYVRELHGDAHMLGYLMSASAIGSLAGAAILAARQQVVGLGKWIRQSSFVYALALLGLSWTHSFVPALCLLAVIGFTMIIQTASVNTILQSVVDENKRGRVMSLYMMAFLGTSPIGGLIAGSIADKVGFATTIFACGLYCLLVSAFFQYHAPNIRKATRHIYVEKGLMAAEEERKLLSA